MKEKTKQWVIGVQNFEKELTLKGYKNLGWMNGWGDTLPVEYREHKDKEHTHNIKSFSPRGSHETEWCEHCKIWWNIDMGD